jgi:hypothetical protein
MFKYLKELMKFLLFMTGEWLSQQSLSGLSPILRT